MRGEPQVIDLVKAQSIQLELLGSIQSEIERVLSVEEFSIFNSTLSRSVKFASERGHTANFLLSHGLIWDAEIVLRSFYEAAVRIVFICMHPKEKKEDLVSEFWGDLYKAETSADAVRASIVLNSFDSIMTKDDKRVFSTLSSTEFFEFSEKNRKERKRLRTKWSFSEMSKALSDSIVGIEGLSHIYGVQSHLLHADGKALDLMLDHLTRPDDERNLKEASHVCRLMSDQVHLWLMILLAVTKAYGRKFPSDAFDNKLHNFEEITKPATEAFNRSQDNFYDASR